jgi:hypothetical protein
MKGLEFQPQAMFLPQVPVHGIGYVFPQMVSQRYLSEQTKLISLDCIDGGTE